MSTNRMEGCIGQTKVSMRRMKGCKLSGWGNPILDLLAAAYWRRKPGPSGLTEAFKVYYAHWLDSGPPQNVLERLEALIEKVKKQAAG